MSSYSDIRIINGSLDEVTRDLIRFFHSQGFNISATACKNSDEAIHLRAENKTTSFWKLIKSSAPQIVDCQLSKFGNDQTQIELTFHSLKIFQNCLYGISFALYCFMAGGLWLSLKIRTPDTTLAAWGTVCSMFLITAIALVWGWAITKIMISPAFFRSLDGEMGANFSCKPTIVQEVAGSPEQVKFITVTLLAVFFLFLPFWRQLGKMPGLLIFFIFVLLWGSSLLSALLIAGTALTRHVQTTLVFSTSVLIVFYGTFPLWILAVLTINLYVMSRQPTINMAEFGYAFALTTEIFLFIIALVIIFAVQLRNLLFMLLNSARFYRSNPEILMKFSKRQLRAKNYILFMFWMLSTAGQFFCVFINLSLVELCMTGHSIFFPSEMLQTFLKSLRN